MTKKQNGPKYTAEQLKAGPEATLSGACISEVTEAFERSKVAARTISEFQQLNLGEPVRDAKGHIVAPDLAALHTAVQKLDGDKAVPEECKTQARQLDHQVRPQGSAPKR